VGNSLQDFPMQSGGAEALRLACTYAAEIRLGVCASLHDALFVVAKIQDEAALADLRACMDRASRDLIGVAVPIEMFVTRYPDRFIPDDKPMAITEWNKMMKALEIAEHEAKKSTAGLAETAGQPEPSMTLVPALAAGTVAMDEESHCKPGTTHLHPDAQYQCTSTHCRDLLERDGHSMSCSCMSYEPVPPEKRPTQFEQEL